MQKVTSACSGMILMIEWYAWPYLQPGRYAPADFVCQHDTKPKPYPDPSIHVDSESSASPMLDSSGSASHPGCCKPGRSAP